MDDKLGGAPSQPNNNGFGSGGASKAPSNFGAHPAPSAPPVKSLADEKPNFGQQFDNMNGDLNSSDNNGAGSPIHSSMGMSVASFAETLRQDNNTAQNTNNSANLTASPSASPTTGNLGSENVGNGTATNMPIDATHAPEPEGLNRPMTKAAEVRPVVQKKPKKGLIIGLICGIGAALLLIIVAVVAVVMLNKPDPVADAMEKLMTRGLPTYVHADLSATAQMKDLTQLVSHYKLTMAADVMTSDLTNTADATVVLGGRDMEDSTFTVNEVFAGGKDLYMRFDGIFKTMDAIDAADLYLNGGDEEEELICEDENGEEVVCDEETETDEEVTVDDETVAKEEEETDTASSSKTNTKNQAVDKVVAKNPFDPEMMTQMLLLSEAIDGEWVQVSSEDNTEEETEKEAAEAEKKEEDQTEEGEGLVVEDYIAYLTQLIENIGGRATVCSADLFSTLRSNASAVSRYYVNHPFIKGSNKDVTLASARYPVYRIVIDSENYEAFVDEVQNQGLLNNYLKCAGETIADVKNYVLTLPPFYVEIDSDNNFSRIYVATNTGSADVVLDLALTYPATINVQRPQEYVTLEDVSEEMLRLEDEAATEEEE